MQAKPVAPLQTCIVNDSMQAISTTLLLQCITVKSLNYIFMMMYTVLDVHLVTHHPDGNNRNNRIVEIIH